MFHVDADQRAIDGSPVLVFSTLAPVFLLIAIGAVLQRTGFVSPGFLKEANRLTYWLGLPALLFSQLARSFHDAEGAHLVLLAMSISTAVVIAVAYLCAWFLRVPGAATGTLVQGAFRGNLAFIGLPIIFALPDTPIATGMSVRAAAVVVVGPTMVVYNFVGVVVLLLSQHKLGWAMIGPFLRQLATTPPLIATIAGIAFAVMGWTLPVPVDKALTWLGEMALPLGLLGVGGAMMTVREGLGSREVWASALIKTAISPLIGWIVGHFLKLDPLGVKMLMILLATPTAIISYAVALEMRGDEKIASGGIVVSVLTSFVSLALVIALF